MALSLFFRRRQVWVPTVWSWLVLFAAGGTGALLALDHVYAFLAPNAPVGAHLLVIEGWMPSDELGQALRVYQQGGYQRAVTTGGPIENELERGEARNFADRARQYLVRRGLPDDAIVAVPAPASAQDRSFLNAVMVREWAARSGESVSALDVVSSGAHSRRSLLLYRKAFGPGIRVGIIAATPSEYDPNSWWHTSAGAREVLGESIAWLWTELFFHPGPPGSPEEHWKLGE
ncbi:MAG: YdcF family protein [Myxococcota bacterium]